MRKKRTSLYWLCVAALPVLVAPMAVRGDDASVRKRSLLAAANAMSAIEQMDAEYVAIQPTAVQQQPNAESLQIVGLDVGQHITVTGRVRERNWYRVIVDSGHVGYVDGGYIRPLSVQEQQVAVVTAPPKPVKVSPVKPAVGVFESAENVFRDCDLCPEMIGLDAGAFTMGSAADPSEQPPHDVTVGHRFAIGRFEVTIAQWAACFEDGGCSYEPKYSAEPEFAPMRNLSWDDAEEYVTWLRNKTGKPYRLPSEAEWEYAARGGTQSDYWWGDELGSGRANCRDCGGEWNRKLPARIGSFAANPFGIHDLNGGVAEWTGDCWFANHAKAPKDGSARNRRDCQKRVLRGGSWRDDGNYMRSASRLNYDASVQYVVNGLRVALTLN